MKNNTKITEKSQKAFGKRIFAGLIDLVLWIVLFSVASSNFGTVTTVTQGSSATANASLTGWPFVIFVLAELSYFVVLEWRLGGTIGKLLLGLRVVSTDSAPITLKQSVIRNILRMVDAFPYIVPYLAGLITAAIDVRKRRLGDRVAGTVVVVK